MEKEHMRLNQIAQEEKHKEDQRLIVEAYPRPKIKLVSSEKAEGKDYLLQFTAENANAASITTAWEGPTELVSEDDLFSKKLKLEAPQTVINIVARNKYKNDELTLLVTREKTSEEIQVDEQLRKADLDFKVSMEEQKRFEEMKENPLDYIQLIKNNWYMGGFGSIPIHSITLKNLSEVAYDNIAISISYYSSNGTLLNIKDYIIYDTLPAGSTKTFKNINMGFVDNQINKSVVEIVNAD